MAEVSGTAPYQSVHPLHAIFLGMPLPLFLGALLSDFAYRSTYQVQWANFSSWLIAGALLGGGLALVCSLVELVRSEAAQRARHLVYFILLLAMWVFGFINALVHAKDAWASMPAGMWWSILVTLLALAASWVGYSNWRVREVK